MRKFAQGIATLLTAIALMALTSAGPVRAQVTVSNSFVSSTGNDGANATQGCQRSAPCQSISTALSKTLDGGIVTCLDSNAHGPLTISISVTIDCTGTVSMVFANVAANGPTAITISAAGKHVVLRGLIIRGVAPESGDAGAIGIAITAANTVQIENCTIAGMTAGAAQGIRLATTSGATNLNVIDTVIANNGLGIRVLPSGGAALVKLLRVQMYDNSSAGFEATSAAGGAVFGNIVDSSASGNGTNGFSALSFSGGKAVVLDMQRSNASLNAQSGIIADGPASKITIGASTVDANGTGFARANGGVILSHGNNNVDDNSVSGSASGSASQM